MSKIFLICLILFISNVCLDEPVFRKMHVCDLVGLTTEHENGAGVVAGPIQSDSGISKYSVQIWTPEKGFEMILVESKNIMPLKKAEVGCVTVPVDLVVAFNTIKSLAKGNPDNLLDSGEIETKARAVGATVFQQYGERGLVIVCEYDRKYLRTLEHVFDGMGWFRS